MPTQPWIPSYIISVIVAALLAASVFAYLPALVFSDQFPSRSARSIIEDALSEVATTRVDRAHKSDRLPVSRVDTATNTTIVPKNAGSSNVTVRGANGAPAPHKIMNIDDEKPAPKLAPTPLVDSEAVASQIADPTLSRSIGRCLV